MLFGLSKTYLTSRVTHVRNGVNKIQLRLIRSGHNCFVIICWNRDISGKVILAILFMKLELFYQYSLFNNDYK